MSLTVAQYTRKAKQLGKKFVLDGKYIENKSSASDDKDLLYFINAYAGTSTYRNTEVYYYWWKGVKEGQKELAQKKEKEISNEEILKLMLERGLTIEKVLDVVVEANGFVGVGLITLGDICMEHLKSKFKSRS